jgi:hypothetical protein
MPDFPVPIWTDRAATNRAVVNKANAQHSTGPRTPSGKARSSLNALTHGLTGKTALLPTEDPAAHQRHTQEFFDEYQPKTPTERQLVQELIDTSWRINRVPALEADVLHRAANPPTEEAAIAFDIVDAHQAINKLALYSHRLSRQFHKTLEQLRDIQAERRTKEERDLRRAAALLEMHKVKGIPYDPAQDGFVFSNDQIEAYSLRLIRLNQSHHIGHLRFHAAPQAVHASI